MAKHGATAQDRLIGTNLRRFRLQRELTQTELAVELNLTFQQVQKYEKGTNRIGGSRIVHICQILGITTAQLLGTDANQRPSTDEASMLGSTPKGQELARAFNRIGDSRIRALLAELAEALASQYRLVAKPSIVRPARTTPSAATGT